MVRAMITGVLFLVSAAHAAASPSGPADVVRRYYAALSGKDYRTAYVLWADGGKASHQTFATFAAGFAGTRRIAAAIGKPTNEEGAAGSFYADIPVRIDAVQSDGTVRHYAGTYTVRRTDPDMVASAETAWLIFSAKVHAINSVQRTPR